MLGAAKLSAATYEEVEADATSTPQAMLVVVLAAVAGGVSAIRATGIVGLVLAALASLLGWYVWAFITFVVGTRLLPGAKTEANLGQLLRTIGFSAAPGVVRVLGIVPRLDVPVSFVASVWMLAAMVVAVRQALDYNGTGRAVAVCIIGFVLNFVLLFVLGRLLGVPVVVAP
jgi:Yip1 domain